MLKEQAEKAQGEYEAKLAAMEASLSTRTQESEKTLTESTKIAEDLQKQKSAFEGLQEEKRAL